jgi:hypothetical protein
MCGRRQRGAQDGGCLGDRGIGGCRLTQGVEHHEVVDDALVPHCGHPEEFEGLRRGLRTLTANVTRAAAESV